MNNLCLRYCYRSAVADNPRWHMVDVQFTRMLKCYIALSELKALHLEQKDEGGRLKNVALFTKARLSVQPLTQGIHYNVILMIIYSTIMWYAGDNYMAWLKAFEINYWCSTVLKIYWLILSDICDSQSVIICLNYKSIVMI